MRPSGWCARRTNRVRMAPMNRFLHGVARAAVESFALPAPVLALGADPVPADDAELPHADASIGTVMALGAFERVPHFWKGFAEACRVLRPDGVLLVSCPFDAHPNGYPRTDWRFTPPALDLLLGSFPCRALGWHGPARRPETVWAVGFREEAETPTDEQLARFRRRLRRYTRRPRTWVHRLRDGVGRLVVGRRFGVAQ